MLVSCILRLRDRVIGPIFVIETPPPVPVPDGLKNEVGISWYDTPEKAAAAAASAIRGAMDTGGCEWL